MLEKGAIFVRPKPDGSHRLIFNSKKFNKHYFSLSLLFNGIRERRRELSHFLAASAFRYQWAIAYSLVVAQPIRTQY